MRGAKFLDIGSGIPTEGHVHEIARSEDPQAPVVYVDLDPTAVVHSRQILGDDPLTTVVQADLHQAEEILSDPQVTALLDLDRPVCLLLTAMLHFVPDSPQLRAALRTYRDALAPGSLLNVSHITAGARSEELARLAELYTRTDTTLVMRDTGELLDLLDGWELVEPGVVFSPLWRPDPHDPPPLDDPATLATVGERR